jgi:hypothetical protein
MGEDVREDLLRGARVLGTVTAVGVLCGWFAAGVVSRLAMFLLIALNPVADGLTSDDGFEMGTFTLAGSANLMFVAGTLLGVLGAGIYVALRGLMVGPRWFRVLSVSLGGGTVVASQLVHAEGVDFTLLGPLWLAVALFVLVPAVFVTLLTLVAERLLARDRPLSAYLWVPGLAAWLVVFPLLPLLAALALGALALGALRRRPTGRRLLASPVGPWVLRAALSVVFALAVLDIARDVRLLT